MLLGTMRSQEIMIPISRNALTRHKTFRLCNVIKLIKDQCDASTAEISVSKPFLLFSFILMCVFSLSSLCGRFCGKRLVVYQVESICISGT
jgi:hypothetical protein